MHTTDVTVTLRRSARVYMCADDASGIAGRKFDSKTKTSVDGKTMPRIRLHERQNFSNNAARGSNQENHYKERVRVPALVDHMVPAGDQMVKIFQGGCSGEVSEYFIFFGGGGGRNSGRSLDGSRATIYGQRAMDVVSVSFFTNFLSGGT